jgi:hypothetical protein
VVTAQPAIGGNGDGSGHRVDPTKPIPATAQLL